jgi:chromosome segregation ATPase
MAKVGAQRAAELTGRSKSTIQRAMNNGKISYEIDPNGRRLIDVSELDRAFGLMSSGGSAPQNSSIEAELEKASSLLEAERLKMRIKMLEAQLESAEVQIEDLKGQRDQWQRQASQVLLTSQYSQKQAEELAAELKAREQRARERKETAERARLEERMKKLKAQNENAQDETEENTKFTGLWKRVKGQKA